MARSHHVGKGDDPFSLAANYYEVSGFTRAGLNLGLSRFERDLGYVLFGSLRFESVHSKVDDKF